MPRFLAIYTMSSESLARFRQLPKSEQDAIDAKGVPLWKEWEEKNEASLIDRGGMVGKTLRVTKSGNAPVTNSICGYVVIEADTLEAAAGIFATHPHLTVFPGDTVDVMPFVT